ncbi:MAG: tyrosine-type recombinase/integrase [Proteobacteria bacterium]|nr:tyrosine-type recombinase/integrase [Pseudomonadota bacterium]
MIDQIIRLPATVEAEKISTHQNRDYTQVLYRFLQSLRDGTSALTVKNYQNEIDRFFHFLGHIWINQVSLGDLLDYKESIKAEAPATRARKLTILRRFFSFASTFKTSAIPKDLLYETLKNPRVQQETRNILDNEDVQKILYQVDLISLQGFRDYLILVILLKCGLREAEITGIKLEDFQSRGENAFLIVKGKGNKTRTIPIHPEVWVITRKYIQLTGRFLISRNDQPSYLFLSRKKGKLSGRHIQRIVKQYSEKAGITKPISPHSFRHTCGTEMALNKAPLQVIQSFLGHSSPQTTMRYVHKAEELISDAWKYNSIPIEVRQTIQK